MTNQSADEDDDLRNRFRRVAVDLFSEHGFERTTVAQIARAAGVTDRTFFRYYPDKRDVVFEGEALVRRLLVAVIAVAPAELSALDAVEAAFRVLRPVLEAFRAMASRHRGLIDATPSLREREGMRLARLVDALAAALERRGAERMEAHFAAHGGVSTFALAAKSWLEADDGELGPHVDVGFAGFREMIGDFT